jgi:hypothetical protein
MERTVQHSFRKPSVLPVQVHKTIFDPVHATPLSKKLYALRVDVLLRKWQTFCRAREDNINYSMPNAPALRVRRNSKGVRQSDRGLANFWGRSNAKRSKIIAQAFRPGNQYPPKCALIRAPQVRVGKPSGIISAGNTFGCPYRTIFILSTTQA